MNSDIERRLQSVSPRGAGAELRPRTLDAVAEELQRCPPLPPYRLFRPGLAAAALLFASVALNVWVNDRIDRRLNKLFTPLPGASQAVVATTDEVLGADSAIAQPEKGRLVVLRVEHNAASEYVVRLQHLIQQISVESKEVADETPRKSPQMGRDRRGSRDRHRSGGQRILCLEHRSLA